MGSVFNRGSKASPNWYVKYKNERGTWQTVPSNQPTKALARQFLAQLEANIANGKVGIVDTSRSPLCGVLMEQWGQALRDPRRPYTKTFVERNWNDVREVDGYFVIPSVVSQLEDIFGSDIISASEASDRDLRVTFLPWGQFPDQTTVPSADDES